MSDDSIAKTEEVEDSLISLHANESEETEDEVVEDETQVPDTVEGLQALLEEKNEIIRKRNKSLKKSKQAQHRTQEEKEAFLTRLEAVEQNNNQQPNVEAENLARQEQEWHDGVEDGTLKVADYTDWKNTQTIDRVAAYVNKLQTGFDAQLAALTSATDPEKAKYSEQIAVLKTKRGFADLDDDVLLTIAKGQAGAKAPGGRGTISGGRGVSTGEPKMSPEEKKEMLQKMGF